MILKKLKSEKGRSAAVFKLKEKILGSVERIIYPYKALNFGANGVNCKKRDTGRVQRRSQSEQNEKITYKDKSTRVFPENSQEKNEEQAEAEGLVWQKKETKEGKKKTEEEAMKVKEITKIEVEKVSQKCSKNSFSKQTNQSISKVTRKVPKPKPKTQFSSGKKEKKQRHSEKSQGHKRIF